MYTNTKLRILFLPFLIIGLIPFYGLLITNTDFSQLVPTLTIWLIKYAIGTFVAILSVFFYLKISHNNSDPKWVTVVGTISMYLFCTYLSFKLGFLFFLGFIFLGILMGMKFYELEFRESFFIGIIFLISNVINIGVTAALFIK